MYRICLINMPFAVLQAPSLALTQLKAVIEERFNNEVLVEIHYINHDFAKFVGLNAYEFMSASIETSLTTGIGDWLFRQSAFPDLVDNTERYLKRYYRHQDEKTKSLKRLIAETRRGLEGFFDRIIQKYKLDRANLVGFTSMFAQNVSSMALARKIKIINPEIISVMGGANCESPMGQEIAKNVPEIDFVFSGPAL